MFSGSNDSGDGTGAIHEVLAGGDDVLRSKLAAIVESSDDAIIGKLLDGTISSWNAGAERIFGYTADEAIGQNVSMLGWPGYEDHIQTILQRIRAGERVDHFETVRRRKDGTPVPISLTVSPIRDASGTIVGASKVARDISARSEAARVQALLAAIVESSEDAIVSKSLEGIVTSWNRGAERVFGYTAEEMIGKPISLLHCPGRENDLRVIMDKIRRGERVDHYEARRRRKDGREIVLSLSVSPIRDNTGKVIGASKVARDITGQKEAANTLRRAEKLAVTGRMAASIAHEINNPLEAVTNLLYLLDMEELPPTAREYVTLAQRELARVAHITAKTLRFYRPGVNASAPVTEILDEALSLFHGRLVNCNITVDRRYREISPLPGDLGELRQIFANLIGNAVDAMPRGGKLFIRAHAATHWGSGKRGLRISIADTGAGMSQETRQRLFEPFYTTKVDTGTGLGLWVSSDILAKLGGNIAVRSSQTTGHSGSAFLIFLPFEAPVPEPASLTSVFAESATAPG